MSLRAAPRTATFGGARLTVIFMQMLFATAAGAESEAPFVLEPTAHWHFRFEGVDGAEDGWSRGIPVCSTDETHADEHWSLSVVAATDGRLDMAFEAVGDEKTRYSTPLDEPQAHRTVPSSDGQHPDIDVSWTTVTDLSCFRVKNVTRSAREIVERLIEFGVPARGAHRLCDEPLIVDFGAVGPHVLFELAANTCKLELDQTDRSYLFRRTPDRAKSGQ